MQSNLSITTMHVLQGGILKRPLPLPVGRTVSDIEGRLYVYLAMSHQLTRRLVGVGDKDRGRVAIIQQLIDLRNSQTRRLLCPSIIESNPNPEETASVVNINGVDGVTTRAKKRNSRETLPSHITIIAPCIDVGGDELGGFPIRVAPLRGKLNSPVLMELTADNIKYLQSVAAHEMRVNPPRAATARSSPLAKGCVRDGKRGRVLCRVQQDGRSRTKVFSERRYKTMAAAEAEASDFAHNSVTLGASNVDTHA